MLQRKYSKEKEVKEVVEDRDDGGVGGLDGVDDEVVVKGRKSSLRQMLHNVSVGKGNSPMNGASSPGGGSTASHSPSTGVTETNGTGSSKTKSKLKIEQEDSILGNGDVTSAPQTRKDSNNAKAVSPTGFETGIKTKSSTGSAPGTSTSQSVLKKALSPLTSRRSSSNLAHNANEFGNGIGEMAPDLNLAEGPKAEENGSPNDTISPKRFWYGRKSNLSSSGALDQMSPNNEKKSSSASEKKEATSPRDYNGRMF